MRTQDPLSCQRLSETSRAAQQLQDRYTRHRTRQQRKQEQLPALSLDRAFAASSYSIEHASMLANVEVDDAGEAGRAGGRTPPVGRPRILRDPRTRHMYDVILGLGSAVLSLQMRVVLGHLPLQCLDVLLLSDDQTAQRRPVLLHEVNVACHGV